MRSISTEFANELYRNSTLLPKATLTLANGTVRQLTGDDIVDMSWEQATSSDQSFDVGAAIIGKLELTLNNHDQRFDTYDFTGSEVVAFVGKKLQGGRVEWIRLGYYLVDQPDSYGGTIKLDCLDRLGRLERPVPKSLVDSLSDHSMRFAELVARLTEACGVRSVIAGDAYSAPVSFTTPEGVENETCLSLLSKAAATACCFVLMASDGTARVRWYDTKALEGESWLDGGVFDSASPYKSGASADGGDFTYALVGVRSYDGGSFQADRGVGHLFACSSMTVATDDVVITGLRVNECDRKNPDGTVTKGGSSLYGTEGYVLDLGDNKLVKYGTATSVAKHVGGRVVGMRFRPFSASAVCDPSLEAGDAVALADAYGNTYTSYVTSVSGGLGGGMEVRCSAKSPGRNGASTYSATTDAIVRARNAVDEEASARELAIRDLNLTIKNSSGLYATNEPQPDGSTIYYLHDKPTLGASKVVWKATAEAIAVSTDGGSTYQTGLTATGDAILRRVYAIGIDADYVKTGRLSSKSGNMTVNLDTGDIYAKRLTIDSPNFKLTPGGEIISRRGTIGGFDIGFSSLSNSLMTLDTSALSFKRLVNGKEIYVGTYDSRGIALRSYDDKNKDVGKIGVNSYENDPSRFGLNFDLEHDGDYMTWAYRSWPGDNVYSMKLTYWARDFDGNAKNTISLGCNMDGHDHVLRRTWLDPDTSGASGGVTGRFNFVVVGGMNGDGTASRWYNNCYLEFKRGMLVGASMPR